MPGPRSGLEGEDPVDNLLDRVRDRDRNRAGEVKENATAYVGDRDRDDDPDDDAHEVAVELSGGPATDLRGLISLPVAEVGADPDDRTRLRVIPVRHFIPLSLSSSGYFLTKTSIP